MKKYITGICISLILLLAVVMIAGYAGPADAAGPAGVTAAVQEPIQPESCAMCHSESGAEHQASYDELYQDGVIEVTGLAYEYSAPNTHIVTFQMTKEGEPFDANEAESVAIYFAPYTGTAFQFEPALERLSLKGELVCDETGACTSTLVGEEPVYESDFGAVDGLVVLYGSDETVGQLPARVRLAKYPFAALLETGAGVDYVSSANNEGCEKCHSVPYLKHGYIYGRVDQDPATDFYTCKACHLDNVEGGHFEWQLMVDDPLLAVDFLAQGEEAELAPELEARYAYEATLMNDVHMSHAMEFPYPQSMANCVTCHEGKLDTILADANFTVQTCKSCHPVTGSEEYGTDGLALETLLSPIHANMDLETVDCTSCHSEGSVAPVFSDIHSGYDRVIYTADGVRYSEVISVTIDSAAFDGDMLSFTFSAAESPDLEGLDVADIVPTVMVGLYGYDTKDYIIGAHERLVDDNGDGVIDSGDQRALEFVVGEEHPRFATVSAEGGSWEVVADLSTWTDLIADDTVRRAEIAVMPALTDTNGVILALDAPSRTFDLAAGAFVDDFYSPIVKVTDGCDNCHAALATNYHTPDRGGNIVVCRMCHITKSGGSHLEMQSRSIDSYAHALHSGQVMDIAEIDFSDPVEAMHYEHHIGFPYPTHGITHCESCHVEGTYEAPAESQSLPGLLSASEPVTGWERNIGEVPAYVTGPGARACGGCHQASLINADDAEGLEAYFQHIQQGGYLIEAGEDARSTLAAVIDEVMEFFK